MRSFKILAVVVALSLVVCCVAGLGPVGHWFRGWYWPESGSGSIFSYAFFSSVGGCSVVGAGFGTGLLTWWHRHNCHTDGCPRIGKHSMAGGKYVICTSCLKKDPLHDGTLTAEKIHDHHRKYHGRVSGT